MINIEKTINLIKNGLIDPRITWQSYLEESHSWKETAMVLSIPLIITAVLLSSILGWIFKSHYMFAGQGGIFLTLLSMVAAIVGLFIASFVFSFLAGVFDGKHDFNRGFAALSLTAIPGYIGSVIGTVPMVGWIISLGLFILSLVYLYKIIPTYLEVPQGKRVIHFVASLIITAIISFTINIVLGLGLYSSENVSQNHTLQQSSTNSGMFGDLQRHSNMIKNAEQDRFTPSKDGYISEIQMKTFVSTMKKSTEYINRKKEGMKEYEKSLENKKEFSFSDLAKLSQGVGSVMSMANAEMEVVKSADGNWAEHQWVKEQLQKASIHRELNDTNKHNYALYGKYKEELKKYGIVY